MTAENYCNIIKYLNIQHPIKGLMSKEEFEIEFECYNKKIK